MSGKPKLHYINGRGRMETIRWLLAAAGVEFEEVYVETRDDLLRLQNSGVLMFQQVPMVEMDGMKLVQSRAICNYISAKHNLYGKDLKERVLYCINATSALKDHGKDFLVGNQLSRADVQLLEIILMAEEVKPDILAKFPVLQSFKARTSNIPTIKKFLQPGSPRKPPFDEKELPKVLKIFY
ncbi:GSTA1 transferase, partial [Nothoprocta pentlandii]|nr:GSTA1 transferase [Nothoprocta pentlandii]